MAKSWKAGELITANKLNAIENKLEELDGSVNGAVRYDIEQNLSPEAINNLKNKIGASIMVGATRSTAGVTGSVPPPAAGDQNKLLRGDGTWYNLDQSEFATMNDPVFYGSITLGSRSGAIGTNSCAVGDRGEASGDYSCSAGYHSCAAGDYSYAEGYESVAASDYSHAEGDSSRADGESAHAEGASSYAGGYAAHSENRGITYGDYSHAEGKGTAEGNYSHAEGDGSYAGGDYSHAEGNTTEARDENAHAEGFHTTASGNASHAEGDASQATGDCSHAEGDQTRANGEAAHAEGISTSAIADAAHAEGIASYASGMAAHAEGRSRVEGHYAHAEGSDSMAIGNYSHAEGLGTIANGPYQHVFGTYNVADTTSVEIVGNGTQHYMRSNIRTLDRSGNEWLANSLTIHRSTLNAYNTAQVAGGFAICETSASVAAKVVASQCADNFLTANLQTGMRISVSFTNANTANSPTLKVDSMSALPIYHRGAVIGSGNNKALLAGVVDFVYDGAHWNLVGNYYDTTTNYYDRTRYAISVSNENNTAIPAKSIAVFNNNGELIPLAVNAVFDITKPILYVGTAYSTTPTAQSTNYITWGTPFALSTTISGFSSTAGKNVYIKGTLTNKLFTITAITDIEPSTAETANGKPVIYMLLGHMSTSANMALPAEHPIFRYHNGFKSMNELILSLLN